LPGIHADYIRIVVYTDNRQALAFGPWDTMWPIVQVRWAAMPASRSTLRAHPLAALSPIVLFLIAATQWIRDASDRVGEMLHGDWYASQSFHLDAFTFEVNTLDPSAEAAGLRKGDLVLAVNGLPLDGLTG
jgi:hypothetical protein